MVLNIIGDLFTHGRQLKHLVFNDRIVSLLGELPISKRFASAERARTDQFAQGERAPYAAMDVGGEVPSVRDQGDHPVGRDQATAQYADLEAGSFARVSVMRQGPVHSARPYDQADGDP
jgi:hypothetical protein